MRFAALFALVTLPAFLLPDRLLTIPTGVTLAPGEAVAEALYRTDNHRTIRFLQVGLPLFLELGATLDDGTPAVHLQYSVAQPFPEYAPGIAVGVWDAGNDSPDGRGLWLAATWQFNAYADWAKRERISFTLGGGSAPRFRGAFVGLDLPVYTGWNLLIEHDSRALTFGVGFEPLRQVRFRGLVRDGRAAYSFTLRYGF
ncbi:MAG: hypothetical protein C4341_03630 [Armatimonadota bacterium]